MGADRGERRRGELLRAATTCLVRDGWAGLTHRRVADEAGATPGLVRYHFGTIAGLRTALATEVCTTLVSPFADAIVATSTIDELIDTAVAVGRGALADRDGGILLAQIVLGSAHHEEVAAVVSAHLEAALTRIAAHLAALDPSRTPEAARHSAERLLAALDGLALRGIARPSADVPPIEPLLRAILAP